MARSASQWARGQLAHRAHPTAGSVDVVFLVPCRNDIRSTLQSGISLQMLTPAEAGELIGNAHVALLLFQKADYEGRMKLAVKVLKY